VKETSMTDNTICAQHDHTHGEPLPGASRVATPSPVQIVRFLRVAEGKRE